MKIILAAVLTLAATTAMAGEGRYLPSPNVGGIPNSIFVTDSQTGQVRLCYFTSFETSAMKCGPWSAEE